MTAELFIFTSSGSTREFCRSSFLTDDKDSDAPTAALLMHSTSLPLLALLLLLFIIITSRIQMTCLFVHGAKKSVNSVTSFRKKLELKAVKITTN